MCVCVFVCVRVCESERGDGRVKAKHGRYDEVIFDRPQTRAEQVDVLAQKLHKAGKISDLCEGLGFYQRWVRAT